MSNDIYSDEEKSIESVFTIIANDKSSDTCYVGPSYTKNSSRKVSGMSKNKCNQMQLLMKRAHIRR